MYSPLINRKRVAAANVVYQQRFPHDELTYHSRAQIEEWNNRLEGIRGKNGSFSRSLREEEDRWVTNERLLCRFDHVYAVNSYAHIKTRESEIVPFTANKAQLIALDVLSEMEEAGVEMVLQFLKARRLGVSTLFELLIWARMMFTKNINAVIGASNPGDSRKLSDMFLLAARYTPYWLRPLCTYFPGDMAGSYKQGIYWEFHFSTDERAAVNRLDIVHGNQEQDIGRSFNPTCVHLTELAKFEDCDRSIDGGLMRAMLPSPKNLACFEGTGEGDQGWWPKKWEYNKKHYGVDGSGSRMRPTFLPWYVDDDKYPTETDLVTQGWYNVRDTWKPNERTVAQAKAAEDFVHSKELLRKHLGVNWKMSREQQFYHEVSIKEYKEAGRLHVWLQEMAADDRGAFSTNYKSVYDPELLMRYRDALPQTVEVFGLKGKCGAEELVPKRYRPIGVDHKRKSVRVVADWTKKYAPFEFELYPLTFKGYDEFNENGKILIWEWPNHGETYAISTDNGDGKGEDRTVIQVIRKGGRERCDAQVCEFASDEISGVDLWPWALALGTLYSVKRDGQVKQPVMIPETNREGGQRLIDDLDFRGWKNFYQEDRSSSTSRGARSILRGWHTSPQNRDGLILFGSSAIEGEVLEINSPELVSEMGSFIRHPDGKKGAAKCLHPNSRITKKDYSNAPVCDIIAGDTIITHKGRGKRVTDIIRRPYDGEMLRLKISGLPDLLEVTPEHPFLVKLRGDKFHLQAFKYRKIPETRWAAAAQLKSGDWVAIPKRTGLAATEFTSEQLYAMGFWLAEGHFWYGKRKECIGIGATNTNKRMLRRIEKTFRAWFPDHSVLRNQFESSRRMGKSHSRFTFHPAEGIHSAIYDWTFCSTSAGQFFKNGFGNVCHDKHIPDHVFNHSGLLALVCGFIDGDGSQRADQDRDVNIYTTSEQLAWQLRQIMIDGGVWCTLRCDMSRLEPDDFAKRGRRPMWIITVKASFLHLLKDCKVQDIPCRLNRHVIEDDKYFYSPIRNVDRFHYKGEVVNLSVKQDASFVANGAAVHNSRHDDRLIALFLAFHALYSHEARATGKDPVIERGRTLPEESLWPVAEDPMASSVTGYIDHLIQEIEWPTM